VAISQLAAIDDDLVTLQEGVELLRLTGRPVSHSTLKRWVIRYRLSTKRIRGTDHVSYSDLLEVHRDEMNARTREPG
jgi:transposase-like protein